MQLLLPPEIAAELVAALTQAGRREIGGILMGEHVGPDTFRVMDLTIQRKRGSFAAFVRIVSEILAPLRAFFSLTQHNYRRFNYLGEWHSHHSFDLEPSHRDHTTMIDSVSGLELGAHFAVLLLVKLDSTGELEARVTVYQPKQYPSAGNVIREGESSAQYHRQ